MSPYAKDSVSLPAPGATPASLVEGLSAQGQLLMKRCRRDMLRPSDAAASARELSGVRHPFSDPNLMRNPAAYGRFVYSFF